MAFDRRQLLNDPEETNRLMLEGHQSMLWTAMPGIVQSVNWSEMTCSVQPAIQGMMQNEDGSVSNVNLPVLIHVPICFPSAGGFTMTLPLKVNDEVLVVIASRCIDAWWQLGGIGVQAEMRMHDLSDGFAIPGPKSVPNVIPNISSTAAQLRTNDGAIYIELGPSGIKLVGNVTVVGTLAASLEVTAMTSTIPIPLSTHLHPGVTSGGSDTGAPIP